jgi:DNA primase
MMNTFDLASKRTNLKKVASTHGGEWAGACPSCGGNDRFRVWPNENAGKGGYWCRSCGMKGDNIQFLIDFEGMTFKDACQYLNIQPEARPDDQPPPQRAEWKPTAHPDPAQIWQEKAEKFVAWAQERLSGNQQQLDWLAARGISQAAAVAARLGWNPGEDGHDIFRQRTSWGLPEQIKENGKARMLWIPRGLVIPYIPAAAGGRVIRRIRIRRPNNILQEMREKYPNKEPARYVVIPGSSAATMILDVARKAFVIVESELDAIACAAATDLAGAVALGTLEGKPDAEAFTILKDALQILNALDYGDQGGGKAAAERAIKWWAGQFGDRCDRWPVPQGKDPGEAYALGTPIGQWIEKGLPPVVTLTARKSVAPPAERREPAASAENKEFARPTEHTPPLLAELWTLLRANPSVVIINQPDRFAILRNGKYVGGRINWLVTREKEVTDYIFAHPAAEINWKNLIQP